MEDERGHEEDVSGGAFADVLGGLGVIGDFLGGEFSEEVTFGDDFEGSVGGRGVVEMDADGGHLLEEFDRGLDVRGAVFEGPGGVVGEFFFFLDRDGEVLVPGDGPVLIGGFIKEDASDGNEVFGD